MSKAYGSLPPLVGPIPDVPTGVGASQNTAGLVVLTWSHGGTTEAAFFQVYRDGTPFGVVTEQLYNDANVAPEATYSYQVQAVSDGGLASGLSIAVQVTTTANQVPIWVQESEEQSLIEGVAYNLSLSGISFDPDGHALTYSTVSGGPPPGVTPDFQNRIIAGTPIAAGVHSHTVRASDPYGGTADITFTYTVVSSDITAPTVPGTPVAGSITTNSIAMSWAASTDASGVAFYKVYRAIAPGSFSLRNTTTSASYTDTGLSSGVTYQYKVSAVDASSNANESAQSGALSATTTSIDTVPPSVPTGLTATAVSNSRIDQAWNASTDSGSGVAGYRLYVATSSGGTYTLLTETTAAVRSYQHTGLNPGTTRFYKVSAFDVAGNESNLSGAVSATTQSTSALIRAPFGHYARFGVGDSSSSIASRISGMASETAVRGVGLYVKWNLVETAKDAFSWSFLDPCVNAAKAANKKVIIRLQDKAFGTSPSPGSVVPSYMVTEQLTYTRSGTAGAALYQEAAMTRNINVYKKILDRYKDAVNADGTPTLAMLLGEESVYGNDVTSANGVTYTAANCITQETRRFNELRAYAPQIPFCWMTNWVTGENSTKDRMRAFFSAARTDKGYYFNGGPDMRPIMGGANSTDGFRVLFGEAGGLDHRGQYMILGSSELFETNQGFLPIDTYNSMFSTGAHIMIWYAQDFTGTTAQRWTTGILPMIRTHAAVMTIPSQLTGLVSTT